MSFENKNTTFEDFDLNQVELSEKNSVEANLSSLSFKSNNVVASVSDTINFLTWIEGEKIDYEMSNLDRENRNEISSLFWDILDSKIEASMASIDEFSINESDSLAQLFWNSIDSEYNPDQFVV